MSIRSRRCIGTLFEGFLKIAIIALVIALFTANACRGDTITRQMNASVRISVTYHKGDETRTGYGTGVLVVGNRVMTANHAVDAEDGVAVDKIMVTFRSGESVAAHVLSHYPDVDVAILGLPYVPEGLPALLLDKRGLATGEDVWTIGNPKGHNWSYSRGYVLNNHIHIRGGWRYMVALDTAPGASGGGLYDSDGKFVGLVVSYWSEHPSMWMAIPMKRICKETSICKE